MGSLFSSSKHQQERNLREFIRGVIEGAVAVAILKAEFTAGVRSTLGTEVSVFAIIVIMHLLWEEFGEPFKGVIDGISSLFITG